MDRLEQMFKMQEDLQRVMPPIREFPSPDMAERMSQIRTSALGLMVELAEGLNETGWKPWASSNHINREAYRGEMVDMWHFFVNLCLLGGVSPEDLYVGYINKHQVNRKRQADGYDGVSTKCPGCKGAYDDPAVLCYANALVGPYCDKLKKYIEEAPPVQMGERCPACFQTYGNDKVKCSPKAADNHRWCGVYGVIDDQGKPITP